MAHGAAVVYKGTLNRAHKDLFGVHLHPPFAYAQGTDPGAVGAGQWWYDTTNNILYVRNSANTGWTTVANVAAVGAYVLKAGDAMTGALSIDTHNSNALLVQDAGTTLVRVNTNIDRLELYNATDFLVFSDAGITREFQIVGSTGTLILNNTSTLRADAGSPEGVVSAPIGSVFLRNDGSGAATIYAKTSGSGNTGWEAVITLTGTQTLSNKTFKDTLTSIVNTSDLTKVAVIDASKITTGTTRTYTLPNVNASLTDNNKGYFLAPGPGPVDTTSVTALASGQCLARFIGYTQAEVGGVEINVTVTTAGSTITWSEMAICTATSPTAGTMSLQSFQSLNSIFNSTGVKTLTFNVTLAAGTYVYVVMGSQAGTPFQVRATLQDEISLGVVKLATVRPSTGLPAVFSSSSAITGAALVGARWL